MRRAIALLALLGLGAGCSDGDSSTASTVATATTTTVAASSTTTTTPATTTTAEPTPDYAASIDELLALGRPIVLAHTAGEDNFPASTMFAFGESVKAGVDMLDLNVLLTKDGALLVQHDDSVDRNTNGTGAVADMTSADIAALDAAYWFSTDCSDCHDRPATDYLYRGMRTGDVPPPPGYTADDFALPTLPQLIERFPDIPLNIEIKGEGDVAKRAADELAKELHDLGRAADTVVASFQDEIVSYFHQIAPDIEVSPGLAALTGWVLDRTPIPDGMRILQLPPEYSSLQVITPQVVADATLAGYPIWVWPNNRDLENLASYRDFLDQGIVGLNINFPSLGVQAVREFESLAGLATVAASVGCDNESPVSPGQVTEPVAFGGAAGSYVRHLPPAYDGATPLPLVITLHGWLQTADLQVLESDLPAFGDVHRFVTVAPEVTRPVSLWNTTLDGPDVGWIGALLDELESTLCIDTHRVFVTGMSNGAMMTATLACTMADRIAAVAPVSGVRNPDGCGPSRPVPLVTFHGTDDQYLSYTGGVGAKAEALPSPDGNGTIGTDLTGFGVIAPEDVHASVPDIAAAWAARNGCDTAASETRGRHRRDHDELAELRRGDAFVHHRRRRAHVARQSVRHHDLRHRRPDDSDHLGQLDHVGLLPRAPTRCVTSAGGRGGEPVERRRHVRCVVDGSVLHPEREPGERGRHGAAMVVPVVGHLGAAVDGGEREAPARDLHPHGRHVERELATRLGDGDRADGLPLLLADAVGALEPRTHRRAGGSLRPRAAGVLR